MKTLLITLLAIGTAHGQTIPAITGTTTTSNGQTVMITDYRALTLPAGAPIPAPKPTDICVVR